MNKIELVILIEERIFVLNLLFRFIPTSIHLFKRHDLHTFLFVTFISHKSLFAIHVKFSLIFELRRKKPF